MFGRFLAVAIVAACVAIPHEECQAAGRHYYSSWSYYPQRTYYYVNYHYKPVETANTYNYHYCIYY